MALVAAGLMVATTNRPDGGATGTLPRLTSLTDVPTTEPGMGQVASSPVVASMLDAVLPSTVALVIDTPTATVLATGLVVEAGGIIVSTSRAIPTSRSVTVVEQGGHRVSATKVGTDPASGISVLSIADDLTPATSDFTGPSSGAVAMAVAMDAGDRPDQSPTPVVYAGKVVAAGVALRLDHVSSTFATFGVEVPLNSVDIGCPLVDADGQVVGVLERVGGKGLTSASTFLPAELVWGVADQLVSSGSVDPGSMGITTADAVTPNAPATPVGAIVSTITPGGPAAIGGIQVGDVVTRLDGHRVRSQAELDTELYTEPAGSEVTLTVDRAGISLTRAVELTDSGPDAPERPPSP